MGITVNCSKFLFYSKSRGVDFTRTLTLGRLNLFATKKHIQEQIEFFGNNERKLEEVNFSDEYSEPLFKILGANTVDSLDYSDYEKATIVHDMNEPIGNELKSRFTAIVDGGTIEHVFNFPVAIKNAMEMLEPGGHYIGITPANNQAGHGFYQFSPELYYRIFSPENGFEVKSIMICTQISKYEFSDWYEVVDPARAKGRVEFSNELPAFLLVLAKKVAEVEVFKHTPQQSDYTVIWEKNIALAEGRPAREESRVHFLYTKFTPKPIKAVIYNLRNFFSRQQVKEAGLGNINPDQYRKVTLQPPQK